MAGYGDWRSDHGAGGKRANPIGVNLPVWFGGVVLCATRRFRGAIRNEARVAVGTEGCAGLSVYAEQQSQRELWKTAS